MFGLKRNSGFTMIEVLVSILVFSLGLLGIAGMMTISVRSNHNGYLRSQANFLAENMADRMRANPYALWADAYSGSATAGGTVCTLAAPCDVQTLAQYDMEQWAVMLNRVLPNGQGSIECVNAEPIPAAADPAVGGTMWVYAPPYPGVCNIIITWSESNEQTASDTQTVRLVVQP